MMQPGIEPRSPRPLVNTLSTSRNELISDVLLWTPSHGRAKAGCPARTYVQQLCADSGCSPEDLPKAMDDREGWRERGSGISMLITRHDDDDDDDDDDLFIFQFIDECLVKGLSLYCFIYICCS